MKRKKVIALITATLTFTMTVCGSLTAAAASELTAESKPATQYTIDANQEVYALLDFEDTAEYSCAVTPQVRQTGNRLSGLAGTAYASLLT